MFENPENDYKKGRFSAQPYVPARPKCIRGRGSVILTILPRQPQAALPKITRGPSKGMGRLVPEGLMMMMMSLIKDKRWFNGEGY